MPKRASRSGSSRPAVRFDQGRWRSRSMGSNTWPSPPGARSSCSRWRTDGPSRAAVSVGQRADEDEPDFERAEQRRADDDLTFIEEHLALLPRTVVWQPPCPKGATHMPLVISFDDRRLQPAAPV